MTGNPRKLVGVFAVLLGVWIAVYWLYQPPRPPITRDDGPAFTSLQPLPLAELEQIVDPTAQPQFADAPASDLSPRPAVVNDASLAGSAPRPAAPRERTVVQAPRMREYVIQRGDTSFEAVAQRVYGDRRLADVISRANPYVTPTRLIPGRTRLNIPLDPTNIQGKVVTLRSAPSENAAPASQPITPAPAPAATPPARPAATPTADGPLPAGWRVHTVEKGQTLSGIAKAAYGRSALWTLIFEANRDVLDAPERVKPGLRLRLPPAPDAGP